MAIEDAVTLVECLERVKTADSISNVLKAFQEIRGPRCKLVQEWSISSSVPRPLFYRAYLRF
jgi:salicylate hydroxylase